MLLTEALLFNYEILRLFFCGIYVCWSKLTTTTSRVDRRDPLTGSSFYSSILV